MSSASHPAAKITAPAARPDGDEGRPFFGLIDSVIIPDGGDFEFPGAVAQAHAMAAWTWMRRDLAGDRIDNDARDDAAGAAALDAQMAELLERARRTMAAAAETVEQERRLRTQLGGDEARERLPIVLNALKCRRLLEKAQSFGRATNAMHDEAALGQALQAMPLQDQAVAALLMQAAIGQVGQPSRLINAVIRITGSAKQAAFERAGFVPLVEAVLSHAQAQIPVLGQIGPFADIDLVCRGIERFHRLIRAVHSFIELERNGRWAMVVSGLTKQVSDRVAPRLREVTPDVTKALRRGREGSDRANADLLLSALNGVFILATLRDSRESLALNALFDQAWSQVGQALEVHIPRNLESLRENPGDAAAAERLDAAIKMAELRFNAEYAGVLRRAKEAAERR